MANISFYADKGKVHASVKDEAPIHVSKGAEIHANVRIGRYTVIGVNSVIYPNVTIGRYCSIARNAEIGVALHPTKFLSTHAFQITKNSFPHDEDYAAIRHVKSEWFHKPVVIGNDVLIGAKAVILPGVKIGHGAIIGSNSVVTRDVAPYEIIGGVPGAKIGSRFNESTVNELLKLSWWDIDIKHLKSIQFDNIDIAIRQIKDLLAYLER